SRRNFARLAASRREPRYVFSMAPSLQVPFPEIEDARPGGFGGNCVVVGTRGEAKSVMRVRENLESMLGPRLFQRSLQVRDKRARPVRTNSEARLAAVLRLNHQVIFDHGTPKQVPRSRAGRQPQQRLAMLVSCR